MKRILIVGAGISGLTVAVRLQQVVPDADITILEQNDRPGGTAWTIRRDGFQVETGPNGFLDTKPDTKKLCQDLCVGDQLVEASAAASTNRYLFVEGKLKLLPNSMMSFLGSDLLSWRAKLGLFWERFRAAKKGVGDESIDAFARRRVGAEVAAVFADALVTGIYAGDPRLLSMPASFPRIAALERTHGSILKGLARTARQRRAEATARGEPYQRPGKMWSFPGGLRVLVEGLRDRLKKPPIFGACVSRIEKSADGCWIVASEGRERWPADALVLACPAHQQAVQLADLDAELAQKIAAIPYNRVAVVALGFRQADVPGALAGFGFIAPQRTRRDVLGVQWCSSIFPGRAPAGAVLLRAMCGGWHRPDVVGWDDTRLLAAVRKELGLAMGIVAEPIFHEIIRWDRAIPQYVLGHLDRVAWIDQRLLRHPGLFLAGNAYRGVALNECTEQGEVLARCVAEFLRKTATRSQRSI